jgi:spore germination protein
MRLLGVRLTLGFSRSFVLVFLTLFCTTSSFAKLHTLAYAAWWLPDAWRTAPLARLDRVKFFELRVGTDGKIADNNGWPDRWQDMSQALCQANTPLDLTLTLLDPKDFVAVFANRVATRQLLETALALLKNDSVSGLHLDFEVYTALDGRVLSAFRGFVAQLARSIKANAGGKSLSVFVPVGGANQIYDTTSLAVVDYVVMQGYDAHWLDSPRIGPLAPVDGPGAVTWAKAVNLASSMGVAADKTVLSYPFFGYEWQAKDGKPQGLNAGKGIITTYANHSAKVLPDIRASVLSRIGEYGSYNDSVSQSSFYHFKRGEARFFGWFEGEWAYKNKLAFAQSKGLGGMAFFVLGYDGGVLLNQHLASNGARKSTPTAKAAQACATRVNLASRG